MDCVSGSIESILEGYSRQLPLLTQVLKVLFLLQSGFVIEHHDFLLGFLELHWRLHLVHALIELTCYLLLYGSTFTFGFHRVYQILKLRVEALCGVHGIVRA